MFTEEQSIVSERDFVASICRESFYDFVLEFWQPTWSKVFINNWHIKVICDELQSVAERVFIGEQNQYDLIINVPPGTSKSSTCSILFPAWIWTRMPEARIIGGSYAHSLSMDLALKNRDVILSDKYRECFPDVHLRPVQEAKSYFMNDKGGARIAVSSGGYVTGFHAHFIIIDDPLNPKQAVSGLELNSANRWMKETLPSRKVDKLLTPTILIMQRLHEDDCTAHMFKNSDEVRHICLPAEINQHIKPASMVKCYKDGLMDPVRMPRKVLDSMKKAMGEYAYAGQFLQHPIPLGGGMFKTDRIKIQPLDTSAWQVRARGWDKAGTKDGGAYTAGVKLGKDIQGRLWILDVVRGQWDSAEREAIIKRATLEDGHSVIVALEQEPGSGGKESAQNTVKNLMGYRIRVTRPTGDKALRADPFSVQVNNGNVYMVPAEWNQDFLNELAFFPNSTFKDQTDACSLSFAVVARKTVTIGAK